MVEPALSTPRGIVLLVDEAAFVRMFIRANLVKRGYGVFDSDNVERALDTLRSRANITPAVVLLEPHVRGGDWQDTLRPLASYPGLGRTPILLVTCLPIDIQTAQQCCGMVVDILYKPFAANDLITKVSAVLQRR